jgi:hypothetical protein
MPEYVFLAGESEGDVTGSMEITEDQTRIIMRANDPNGLSYEWIVINTGEAVDEGHGYYLNVGVIYTVNLPRGAGKVVTVSEGPALGNYLPDAQASWDEAVSASNAILERAANYFPGGVDRLGETKAPDDPVAFRPSVFFGGSPVINSVPKHPTKVFITKDGNTTGIDIVSRPDWNADRVLDNLITMSPMSAAQVAEAAEEKGLTLPTSGVEYPYDDVTFYKHMKAIIDQLTPEVQ